MKRPNETKLESSKSAGLTENLRGILIPFPTPFDLEGDVDSRALRRNISTWNEMGISGYVALGSTGERVHLNERECLEVIETARASMPESFSFIVGAGQSSTRTTIDEARRFASAGADALLVITPHFYRKAMTPEALVGYYEAVADASPVPVVLYSMPDLTGIAIAPETVARLSEHENIIGIKDSSSDIVNLAEMLRLVPVNFNVLTGSGPLLYAALSAGARGAILAVGCVAARLAVAIQTALRAGDPRRALDLQRRLTPLARAVTTRYGIGGLKAALDILGFAGGAVRAPLQSPGEDARREIKLLLRDAAWPDEDETRDEELGLAGAQTL